MLEKLTYNENVKDSDIVKVANLNKGGQKGDVISPKGISTSLTATDYKQPKQIEEPIKIDEMGNIRIRKLTPTECYKLQGFTAEDCKKASEAGISNSQLYKQAGNSICVSVLEAIYKSLGERYEEFRSVS